MGEVLTHGYGGYCRGCRCVQCRTAKRAYARGWYRENLAKPTPAWTAEALGVRPFVAPPCTRCGARLADPEGNPRWDVVGLGVSLVCLGGCTRVRRLTGVARA